MVEQSILYSEHLILRPFTLANVGDIVRLGGDGAIAAIPRSIPHPYTSTDRASSGTIGCSLVQNNSTEGRTGRWSD